MFKLALHYICTLWCNLAAIVLVSSMTNRYAETKISPNSNQRWNGEDWGGTLHTNIEHNMLGSLNLHS